MSKYFYLKKGLILSFLFIHGLVFSQGELYIHNFDHLYKINSEITVYTEVISTEKHAALIFLKMVISENRTRIKDLQTTYGFTNRYSEKLSFSKDTISLLNYRINTIGNEHFFNLQINNPNDKKILVLKIRNSVSGKDFVFDIPLNPQDSKLTSGIVLMKPDQSIPYFRNYVKAGDFFKLANFKTDDSSLYIYHYSTPFPIAAPPFTTLNESISKELIIDSVFSKNINEKIQLYKPGLYFAQYDTLGVNGLAFRNESKYFPHQTSYEELIKSLTYFSTTVEMNKLITAPDKKKAFDEYWLGVTKSPDRARKVIKEYYKRVRFSNELFTTYKQGWKTDKGMIFVIFGAPDEVKRDGKKEEWIYDRNMQLPRLSFEFQKVESIFTHDHYVLIRKKSYQQVWYKAIDLWRKGQIEA